MDFFFFLRERERERERDGTCKNTFCLSICFLYLLLLLLTLVLIFIALPSFLGFFWGMFLCPFHGQLKYTDKMVTLQSLDVEYGDTGLKNWTWTSIILVGMLIYHSFVLRWILLRCRVTNNNSKWRKLRAK